MKVKAALSVSFQGARPVQEDCALAEEGRGIFVVADGFGGPAAGAAASRAACAAVQGFLKKEAVDPDATLPFVLRNYYTLAGNVLFNALVHANRRVIRLNQGKGVHEKGGSSVVAGFVDGDLLALANVGATTAWLIRDGRATELVQPRTYARLCDPMDLSESSERQVPLMALGLIEDLEPEITEYRLREGDWVLLQTDGLSNQARQQIQSLQLKNQKPALVVEEVSTLLKDCARDDNLSITLAIF